MKGIVMGRVLIGGIVAGVLYNIGGVTIAAVLDLAAAFERLGVEPSAGVAMLHVTLRLIFGLVSVFLYAAIRPRFGPGPAAAVFVGVLLWLTAYVPSTIVLMELGVFTTAQAAGGIAWGLLEACLATVVGAWLYREPEPAAGR